MPSDCPYTEPGAVCVADHDRTVHHTMVLSDVAPLPPLRWCQHCGDDIGGQGRPVCRMCEADVAERGRSDGMDNK
jgi:hypothetical protein